MDPSTKKRTASVFRGIVLSLSAGPGFAFLFGAGLIRAVVPGTDRILAEIGGFAVVVACGMLGISAKGVGDRLEAGEVDPNGPKSFRDALRK